MTHDESRIPAPLGRGVVKRWQTRERNKMSISQNARWNRRNNLQLAFGL